MLNPLRSPGPQGTLFAAQYTIAVTAAITFAEAPYDYDAFLVGVALLSFGIGNILGSIIGGRLSDRMLARLKRKNGGVSEPEVRPPSPSRPSARLF